MKKIIIINNDLETMGLLQSWLENKNYEAVVWGNRNTVKELIMEYVPDLIIADILQYKAVQAIKSDVDTMSIPILLMSGYTKGNEEIILDIDDVIEKPFNFPLLEKKISDLLNKQRRA